MKRLNHQRFYFSIIDVIFGPIESYSLAQVARFAGAWETPLISPGGFSEAFTMKNDLVSEIIHTSVCSY